MIPFALASAMTHAGLSPLCFCCCPVENDGGGTGFPDSSATSVTTPKRKLNPLLQVVIGEADSAVDSDVASAPGVAAADLRRRHLKAQSGSQLAGPEIPLAGLVAGTALPDDDFIDLLGLIAIAEADDEEERRITYLTLGGTHE